MVTRDRGMKDEVDVLSRLLCILQSFKAILWYFPSLCLCSCHLWSPLLSMLCLCQRSQVALTSSLPGAFLHFSILASKLFLNLVQALSPHLQCSKVSPSSLPCFSVLLNLAHPQVIAASASKSGSVKPVLTLAWNDQSALKLFLSTFLVGYNFCWKKLNDKPIAVLEVTHLA